MNMVPSTSLPIRIGTLFGRRPSSKWSEKEIKAYRKLVKDGCFATLDDLRLVEAYYIFNKKKPDNYLRRDLGTFLSNWHGELDRARAWEQTHKAKVRKANPPRPVVAGNATDEDFKQAGEIARAAMQELRQKLYPNNVA